MMGMKIIYGISVKIGTVGEFTYQHYQEVLKPKRKRMNPIDPTISGHSQEVSVPKRNKLSHHISINVRNGNI